MADLAPVLIVFIAVLSTAWVIRTIVTNRRRLKIAQMQSDLQQRLLERFGTGGDLAGFLASDSGHQFLQATTTEKTSFHDRILGSVQAGIILLVMGSAMAVVGNMRPRDWEGFIFLGILGAALGVGFLLASGAVLLLSKRWGLIDREAD
jgi:hypothetical protein